MKVSKREGIMLAYPFEEKRLLRWSTPWIMQPKLDGVRCRAIIDEVGGVRLLSSEQNEITSVPHINAALERMYHDECIELDGELYSHGMSFEDIVSRTSRDVNLHDGHKEIEYYIFDIVDNRPQRKRTADLIDLPEDYPISIVPTTKVDSLDIVMSQYDQYVKSGFEGMIIRNAYAPYLRRRSIWMMKFKPKKSDIYLIAGYKEEISIHGQPKGSLGALILKSPDIYRPGLFSVGTGFTTEQREDLWKRREELVGLICEVKYQHLTDKGVPRFPVYIQVLRPSEVVGRIGGHL